MGTTIDASVVIAWQNPAHVFHREATAIIIEAEIPLHMSELNLAEVLVGIDRDQWTQFMNDLRGVGFEWCNPSAPNVAQSRLETGLRMPDAYVIATAHTCEDTAILSFDSTIVKAAQALGLITNSIS